MHPCCMGEANSYHKKAETKQKSNNIMYFVCIIMYFLVVMRYYVYTGKLVPYLLFAKTNLPEIVGVPLSSFLFKFYKSTSLPP